MIKVWHIGGEDVHMRIPMLRMLSQRGYEVAAVGTSPAKLFEDANITYYEMPLSRWVNPASDVLTLKRLASLINEHKPDIVHGFDTKPALFAPIAASAAKHDAKAVRTINGMGFLYSEDSVVTKTLRPVYQAAQRFVKGKTSHTIFQNSTDQAFFLENAMVNGARQSLVSGSGVRSSDITDEQRQQAVDAVKKEFSIGDEFVVLMVARLVKNKGVVEYLDAARKMVGQGVNARFFLVGPHASEGSQAVDDATLDSYRDVVTITGPRSDVPTLLSASDLFVLPTNYREGVPRALLEAATVGVPLVATRMPGCIDVIEESVNGLLVETRSSVAIAEAVNTMLEDIDQWRSRAMDHRGRIEKQFGIETIMQAHDEIYQRVLQS